LNFRRGANRGSEAESEELVFEEKLVKINRVAKVMKGGRRLSFTALVVVGDGKGQIGMGIGKAKEVAEAIRKGNTIARKNMINVVLYKSTIPHESKAKFGSAEVLLKPAVAGTGVIAGGGVRAVVEVAGIKDILTKSLGNENATNVVKATMLALSNLKNPRDVVAARKAAQSSEEVKISG